MALPSNVGVCEITGTFIRGVADGSDPDRDPDGIPAAGLQFWFTPDLKPAIAKIPSQKRTITIDPVPAATDENGVLIGPDGLPGVRLIASNDTDMIPNGWTWKVTVSGDNFPSVQTSFPAPVGGVLDFSEIVPVPPSPGNQVQIWQAVVDQATTAAGVAVAARDDAVEAAGSVQRDAPNGIAPLDAGKKIPELNLPTRLTEAGLSNTFAPVARRFVVFGDSWTTPLDGVSIPNVAIAAIGAQLVKNHGVAGAFLGPKTYGSEGSVKSTQAQAEAAAADTSYDKSLVTDVLMLGGAGVNNIGGFLPTVPEAVLRFAEIRALYPRARFWYATNSKKSINNSGSNDPWRWYNRFFEAATLAGFEVAPFSPMWNWGARRTLDGWWLGGSTDTSVHMSAAGQNAYAQRLAAFLTGGDGWRPFFKVGTSLHANATTLVGTAAIGSDETHVDGTTLRLRVAISGMDSLSAVDTSAYHPILQIPTAYCPVQTAYGHHPAGARLTGGTMDWKYTMRVNSAGVVEVDGRLLNDHVGYFVLKADLPLTTIVTPD